MTHSNFSILTGDFPAVWNSINNENPDLNHNSSPENALGINGEWILSHFSLTNKDISYYNGKS